MHGGVNTDSLPILRRPARIDAPIHDVHADVDAHADVRKSGGGGAVEIVALTSTYTVPLHRGLHRRRVQEDVPSDRPGDIADT